MSGKPSSASLDLSSEEYRSNEGRIHLAAWILSRSYEVIAENSGPDLSMRKVKRSMDAVDAFAPLNVCVVSSFSSSIISLNLLFLYQIDSVAETLSSWAF